MAKMSKGNEEIKFKQFYATEAKKRGLNPNPDAPEHHYNYRAAYKAGAKPDASGHWPSKFKEKDHPNRYVNGEDTITGKRAPAKSVKKPVKKGK